MTVRTFECALCHIVFTSTSEDGEAEAELEKNFPGASKADCVVVCDDCYNLALEKLGMGQ